MKGYFSYSYTTVFIMQQCYTYILVGNLKHEINYEKTHAVGRLFS
jgi:hypothetical protein